MKGQRKKMKIEDYNEYYVQGSDHYLIPKDVFNELFDEMVNWREESQKKKEVIDNIKKCFDDGYFEDGCDCLIIEKYIDSYLKEVS